MAKVPAVNQQTCIGCGTCVSIAGKTFKLNKEGKSEVILPPGDKEAKIQEAIDCCPVSAISWSQ